MSSLQSQSLPFNLCSGQMRSLTSNDSAIDTGTIPAHLQCHAWITNMLQLGRNPSSKDTKICNQIWHRLIPHRPLKCIFQTEICRFHAYSSFSCHFICTFLKVMFLCFAATELNKTHTSCQRLRESLEYVRLADRSLVKVHSQKLDPVLSCKCLASSGHLKPALLRLPELSCFCSEWIFRATVLKWFFSTAVGSSYKKVPAFSSFSDSMDQKTHEIIFCQFADGVACTIAMIFV